MKARTKQIITDFLYEDLTKLEQHTNKLFNNLYFSHLRYHNENYKEDVEEVERLISYWQSIAKNLNK